MTNAEISRELKRLIDDALESQKKMEEKIIDFRERRPETNASDEYAYRSGWAKADYDYLLKSLLRLTIRLDEVEE